MQVLRVLQYHAHVADDAVHRLAVLFRQRQHPVRDGGARVHLQHHPVLGGDHLAAVLVQVGLQRRKVRLAGDRARQVAALVQDRQPHAHAARRAQHVLHVHAHRRQVAADLIAHRVVVHHADKARRLAQPHQVLGHVAAHAARRHLHVAHVALQRHVLLPGKALHVHEHRTNDQHGTAPQCSYCTYYTIYCYSVATCGIGDGSLFHAQKWNKEPSPIPFWFNITKLLRL